MTGFYEATGGAIEPVDHDLNFHNDVFIKDPVDGQILVYNASTELWENVDDTAGTVELNLDELQDVNLNALTDGQIIVWQASTSTWVNATPGSGGGAIGLGELTDVTISAPVVNDRLTYDGGQWVNLPTSNSLENPVTIGNGAADTDATLILNAGATPETDFARVEYQNNSIVQARQGTNVSATGDRAQFYTSMMTPGASEPTLVTLIWSNPDTPTLTEFALANKTQFRIYKGTGTSAADRELESFGQGTTANGLRVMDAATGAAAAHMTSTDTYNEVLLNRKTTGTSAIRMRAASATDSSYIEIDGYVNFTGGNSSAIRKDGSERINFDNSNEIRMRNNTWIEDALRLRNRNVTNEYYSITSGDIYGGQFLVVEPSVGNSGFVIRARSPGGTFYDLVGDANGNLNWRGSPVVAAQDVVLKSTVREALVEIATIMGANPQKIIDIENYLTSKGIV